MMYQVQYQKPKKKGYANHNATFLKIEDAIFWEKVMTKQGCKTSASWLSKGGSSKVSLYCKHNQSNFMDDIWSEIQDMPGEIFDLTELEENDSKMNIKCDEFNQTDYTI